MQICHSLTPDTISAFTNHEVGSFWISFFHKYNHSIMAGSSAAKMIIKLIVQITKLFFIISLERTMQLYLHLQMLLSNLHCRSFGKQPIQNKLSSQLYANVYYTTKYNNLPV